MKIIKKGQDFKYHVQIFDKDTGEEIQITSQNYYKVQIYTNDSRTWIDTTSYIDANYRIHIHRIKHKDGIEELYTDQGDYQKKEA